jgi:hypothetical protein
MRLHVCRYSDQTTKTIIALASPRLASACNVLYCINVPPADPADGIPFRCAPVSFLACRPIVEIPAAGLSSSEEAAVDVWSDCNKHAELSASCLGIVFTYLCPFQSHKYKRINPLPVQFKSLLPGQEGCVFFSVGI